MIRHGRPMAALQRRLFGEQIDLTVPVETWLAGARSARLSVPPGPAVIRVEIDYDYQFPDSDRSNNVWSR